MRSSESFVDTIKAVIEQRGLEYAPPDVNHELTARLWDLWLHARRNSPARQGLTPEDVCIMNILQKVARLAHASHDDSLRDIIGYAENVSMLRPGQRNFTPRQRAEHTALEDFT